MNTARSHLETIETRPVFDEDRSTDLEADTKNRAKDIIEDFMIAANGVSARFLAAQGFASFGASSARRNAGTGSWRSPRNRISPCRSSRIPRRWIGSCCLQKPRILLRFPDLSLTIIKLLGAGEYVLERSGAAARRAFRPCRQRLCPLDRTESQISRTSSRSGLLKAAVAGEALPYSVDELEALAQQCTEEEDAAKKVERQVEKSAAALLLQSRVGETFDAIVTGASPKGTWVRLFHPPVEGKLVTGAEGMAVGRRLRVQLVHTDVEHGYIDFKRV